MTLWPFLRHQLRMGCFLFLRFMALMISVFMGSFPFVFRCTYYTLLGTICQYLFAQICKKIFQRSYQRAKTRRGARARRAKQNGCSAFEHPFGEVLPELGGVAGDHRGAIVLALAVLVPGPLGVADGDHLTVEGDLDGLPADQPRSAACEQVVGAAFEAVGGEGVDDGVLHRGSSSFSGLLSLAVIILYHSKGVLSTPFLIFFYSFFLPLSGTL